MKRIAFVLALVLATFSFAFAAQDVIEVQLDGVTLNFTDSEGNTVNPQMINNRTMVPMRKIFEIFKAEVDGIKYYFIDNEFSKRNYFNN